MALKRGECETYIDYVSGQGDDNICVVMYHPESNTKSEKFYCQKITLKITRTKCFKNLQTLVKEKNKKKS